MRCPRCVDRYELNRDWNSAKAGCGLCEGRGTQVLTAGRAAKYVLLKGEYPSSQWADLACNIRDGLV